ncbi:hypothetical protein BH09BAC3_BH09BAC3_18280 [soil metagenome]
MTIHLKKSLYLILTILVAGCQEEEKNNVIIKINAINILAQDIKVTFSDMDHFRIGNLSTTVLNQGGQGVMKFELTKPTMAHYEVGQKSGVLFVSPGDRFQLNFNIEGKPSFTGKGKEVNNYLAILAEKTHRLKIRAKLIGADLQINKFKDRYDSLEKEIALFHKNYTDSIKLTDEAVSLMKKRNDIILKNIKQDFTNFLFANEFTIKLAKISRNEKIGLFQVPEKLKIAVPLDTALLEYHLSEYGLLLRGFIQSNFYNPIYDFKPSNFDRIKLYLPSMADKKIREAGYPDQLKRYLISENIFSMLIAKGITPSVDSIFTAFKSTDPSAPALQTLQKVYDAERKNNPK